VFLGKARFVSRGVFARDASIEYNVRVPYAKGCFIEAVINLDRLIDVVLEFVLTQAYATPAERAVADDFKRVYRLTGAKTAEILMHRKVIPHSLYQKINKFKNVRGILAHDALGEHALLSKEQEAWSRISSQAEFDAESKKKIDEALRLGEEAHAELIAVSRKLRTKLP
jgi:hypothetical protein